MAKFVQIQSNTTIRVTTGLQNKDVTNPDAHVPDRLKINPEWPKYQVLIKQGAHKYPAEIAEWPTVKALVKDKIITIGSVSELDESEMNDTEKAMLNTVGEATKEFRMPSVDETKVVEKKTKKSLTLNDLANDECNK